MKRLIAYLVISPAVVLLALSHLAYGQDWREHVDEKARVRFSLPADWKLQITDQVAGRAFSSISPDVRMLFFLTSEDPGFATDDPVLLERYSRVSVPQWLEKRNVKLNIKSNSMVLQAGNNNNIRGVTFQMTVVFQNAEYKMAGVQGFYKDRAYTCVVGYAPDSEGYVTQSFISGVFQRLAGYDPPPPKIATTSTPHRTGETSSGRRTAETSSSSHRTGETSGSPARNEKWSIVMSRDLSYEQTYQAVDSVSNNDWVKRKWDEGYYITSLASGDRRWLVVMSKGMPYTEQTFSNEGTEFPADFIKDKWEKGFHITSVAHQGTSGKWVALMTKGTGLTRQTYFWSDDDKFPRGKISEKWNEGYEITYVATDQKKWLIVMSKESGYTNQTDNATEDSLALTDWINQKWKEGYYVTSVATLHKQRLAVMSKGPNYTKQFCWTTEKLPEDWINEIWKSNYRLTSIY